MMTNNINTETPFKKIVDLLCQLHVLMFINEDDDRGHKLRLLMEVEWYKLSDEEEERFGGLSEDLYTIGTNRTLTLEAPDSMKLKLLELADKFKTGDWDKVLYLLREVELYLDPDKVAFLRGRAWEAYDCPNTGLLFHYESIRLNKNDVSHYATVLRILNDLEKYDDAYRVATEALRVEHINATYRTYILTILLSSMRRKEEPSTSSELLDIAMHLESSISSLRSSPEDEQNNIVYIVCGYLLLIAFYDDLGNDQKSDEFLNMVTRIAPDNAQVLTMHGIHLYGRNNDIAIASLRKAIEMGEASIWPYFYLAHNAIISRNHEMTLRLTAEGRRYASRPQVMALLIGWEAIAKHELGYDDVQVSATFEEALRLSPSNDTLLGNYRLFNELRRQRTDMTRLNWMSQDLIAIHAMGVKNYGPVMPEVALAA